MLLALASPAFAEVADDGFCRNGGFPSENKDFGLSVVTAGRAYLLDDMDGCPSASDRCRQRAYVVQGNEVLTGRTKGDYVCAYFPNKGGGSAGWIDRKQLKSQAVETKPALAAWLGWWSENGNPVAHITRHGSGLHLESEAFWPGRIPQKDWPPGWPHTGGTDGDFAPNGNRAHFTDSEGICEVDFTLVGKYLMAADNGDCGGMNVRLDGVYQRDEHARFYGG
jgi:hypothetical protein